MVEVGEEAKQGMEGTRGSVSDYDNPGQEREG